jgi:hypothetical protein
MTRCVTIVAGLWEQSTGGERLASTHTDERTLTAESMRDRQQYDRDVAGAFVGLDAA